jgi:hypothetical protein
MTLRLKALHFRVLSVRRGWLIPGKVCAVRAAGYRKTDKKLSLYIPTYKSTWRSNPEQQHRQYQDGLLRFMRATAADFTGENTAAMLVSLQT